MNGRIVQIEVVDHYGTPRYYPICENAKKFAKIAKTKTLTMDALRVITSLGYFVKMQEPKRELDSLLAH